MNTMFFDSHGGLWEVCACDHARAEAFGPHLCAARVQGGPTYTDAKARGLVVTEDGWDFLVVGGHRREEER